MSQVVVRGESVYTCDVCSRSLRVPSNKHGMEVINRCIITGGCIGKLRRVTNLKEINDTPALPPEQQGVRDWSQRRILYTHNQPLKNERWIVHHNLSNRPTLHPFVNRFVGGVITQVPGEPIDELTIDSNTSVLVFANAESGSAQCVGSSSQNTVNPLALSDAPLENGAFQVSSNFGEITLATTSQSGLVGLSLAFRTPGAESNVTIEYAGLSAGPASASPWVGSSRAVINGKQYTLRSFNITRTPLAPAYFAAGAVPEGSMFSISSYNGSPPKLGECLILLSRPPHASVDRITDKYIDVSLINPLTPELYYSTGRAFSVRSVIRSTYPQILVV